MKTPFLVATAFAGLLALASSLTAAVEIKVGEGERFTTIQAAVDSVPAKPDQPYVIVIKPGIYAESVIISQKDTSATRSLTLKSEKLSRAIIDAGDKEHALFLRDQNHVTLDGLTLKGGTSYGTIYLLRASNNTIRHCVVQDNKAFDGITLAGSLENVIEHNILLKNTRAGVFLIHGSKDNIIRFNIITLNKWGVYSYLDPEKNTPNEPILEKWNDYHRNQQGDAFGFQLSHASVTSDPILVTENNTVRLSTRSDFLRWAPGGDATPELPEPKKTK